jgi:predicted alpha/beta-hydrolase family hydrolase
MAAVKQLRISVDDQNEVSALLEIPANSRQLLVLAHGAGAGMHHPFLEHLSAELASARVATLRYQFPYMEHHRRIPDSPKLLTATVAAAVRTATAAVPSLPVFAGGKSMGGRMTSQAAAQGSLNSVNGLVFFGFPLHPPDRPGTQRAEHLAQVTQPMLFLQGTRDTFARLDLLRPVCRALAPRATLHLIDSADHSFHMPKSAKWNDAELLHNLAHTAAVWATAIAPSPRPSNQ